MGTDQSARSWFMAASVLRSERLPAIDFQMHTNWSDGRSSVSEMIAAARTKALHAIAFTEHVNSGSSWFPKFVAEVKAERCRGDTTRIYFGAEIAATDYRGNLKADFARLDAELVLGVVHRLPKQDGSGFWNFEDLRIEDAVELELRALLGLAGNLSVDVLGHPGGTTFKKYGAFPVEWLESAFVRARDHGIAVELNSKYLWDIEGMVALLQRVNPMISLGSDAHQADEVGAVVDFLQQHSAEATALPS